MFGPVSRRRRHRRLLVVGLLAAPLVTAGGDPVQAVGEVTVTFAAVGNATWNVPSGVTSARFVVSGAQGGDASRSAGLGGRGATVDAVVALTPRSVVSLTIGGRDGTGGGGPGGTSSLQLPGGAGGGASTVRIDGSPVIVAAGGGGAAAFGLAGGASGAVGGASDFVGAGRGGAPGTATAGGTGGAGGPLSGYPGCAEGSEGVAGTTGGSGSGGSGGPGGGAGGGGGGGLYGGGGGGSGANCASSGNFGRGGGGGGGSSLVPAGASLTDGGRAGDGVVSITYIDAVGPDAAPTQTPPANAAGWNNTPVTVTWNWSDDGAGIGPECTASTTSTGSGVQTLAATCADLADNSTTAEHEVRVDLEAAAVAIAAPTATFFEFGSTVVADYTCTDAGSGIESCDGTVADGAAIDTSAPGPQSFTVTATDVAGNVTEQVVEYTVLEADAVLCDGAIATIVGTNGPDALHGTEGADVIAALDGPDVVYALGGDDVVCGGGGPDVLRGDGGADLLLGDEGADFATGGGGSDTCSAELARCENDGA